MEGPLAMSIARAIYGLGWTMAMPLLRRHKRLSQGYEQRTLQEPLPEAGLWIQAASGGEAYLAAELLRALADEVPRFTALATTNTAQGLTILEQAAAELNGDEQGRRLYTAFCPFDKPGTMARALFQVRPKVVVLLESELWPGLLTSCRKRGVPVVLVNGRMRPRSLAGYLAAQGFMRAMGPREALAISKTDAMRLGLLFGRERVSVMPNMKFDRVRLGQELPYARNPLATILRAGAPFVVLGSVRTEEEPLVERVIAGLLRARPGTIVGLFPRHMERITTWQERLTRMRIRWTTRGSMSGPASPGTVILWDAFGELDAAYHLARAAFVGGSLVPLGGQNFLEPLAAGVAPVIGPHWDNFAWVGTGLMDQGLVRVARTPEEVAGVLVADLNKPRPRDLLRAQVEEYVSTRRGGAKFAAGRIAKYLNTD
ncbi:3-deoxy-D-manno-octulosonic acid transferase [Desulfocurvibacter africanus]|uniref:3-deoxy-D-manno-octulosonic acid transferase n=2 Tax=Desulfocurvibacter africanus TaxID=873 RepID=UPI00041F4574|nr:glycosyltransferase N-terminal domain-containing protein [Desulfocurvibacter africanus]